MSLHRTGSSPVNSPRSAAAPSSSSYDSILPGPPSRSNFGASDLSPSNLLAYAAGSSVAVLDSVSLQLVSVIPLPPPTPSSLSPFITSLRWAPHPLPHDLSLSSLTLAVGDRHGRVSLLDFRTRSVSLTIEPPELTASAITAISNSSTTKLLGVQDLCWVQCRIDSYLLASINGQSLLSIYNPATGRCVFKYDSSPEYLSCIRLDPFDSRHFLSLGLKGFILSIKALGENEGDFVIKECNISNVDCSELNKLEKDLIHNNGGGGPALGVFPTYNVRFAFSPQWKQVIFVTFPREFLVFDLQYECILFTAGLPRGCGKFLDVLPDLNKELIYCAHLDGKLSTWRRKEGEQAHIMCAMEELIPSIGTSIPSPLLLAVVLRQSDSTLQNVGRIYSDVPQVQSPIAYRPDDPFDLGDESHLDSKAHLVSISDDGNIWNWLLTLEERKDSQEDGAKLDITSAVTNFPDSDVNSNTVLTPTEGDVEITTKLSEKISSSRSLSKLTSNQADMTFKISLIGQLHLLSSTVTMLAVPSPSLTATLARGGNNPAVAVPLVALGTQNGTIDVIDVSANAVAASFSVHNGVVRGLRWLGNSRLVSFSYTQVNEKSGNFVNRLAVTCLRSGLNRTFRVHQKPERTPIRALRTSSSGRYLLILFRDAPVEVWAMTKNPIMLRSLALPFTVLEWTLPTVPRPVQNGPPKDSPKVSHESATTPAGSSPTSKAPTTDSKVTGSDGLQDDTSESFAFALVNGALGVFEVQGRRIRDFRPKWPTSSFVASDGLITAMAYRLPHVVMGDRSGNIRWWDVTTGHSSSFNTHRDGIRRIKFSPVVTGDQSRGRIAVLFYDNTFAIFDLDSQDPLANSLLQPQLHGTLVLELDWLPLRTDKNEPLVLCIAGADSSFRLVEINMNNKRISHTPQPKAIKERFRPMPLCSPILLPTPHALALRMIIQLGVKPSWFNQKSSLIDRRSAQIASSGDLRGYMLDLPSVGDSVVPELLLKILEPYRKDGCILDDERAKLYTTIINRGSAVRFAFAAAIFGESAEALFWLQLPRALNHLMNRLANKSLQKAPVSASLPDLDDSSMLSRITSKGKKWSKTKKEASGHGQLKLMAFEESELWGTATERIPWHEKLEGEEAIQNRVHELVSVGNLEGAVSLLLSTSPESSYFNSNALRAVALASAVSTSLLELAVKVVAANMVRTDKSLSGIHLLCAVRRYQEACSQLQDAGCWTDAATLAATHLKGSDYARVLQRWAGHILNAEHNIWRALILYVAAGSLHEALAALREAQQPDTAAMFILACREICAAIATNSDEPEVEGQPFVLPGLDPQSEEVITVGEYFGQYQRKLVHLCMDSQPFSE